MFDLLTYAEKYNFNLRLFVENWRANSDKCIFKLYQRDQLKHNDVVMDFANRAQIDVKGLKRLTQSSNPSISGSLLSVKILMNLCGVHDRIEHSRLLEATELSPRFIGKIFINAEDSASIRERSNYNFFLEQTFGDVTMASFATGNKLFDPDHWEEDIRLLDEHGYLDDLKSHPVFAAMIKKPAFSFKNLVGKAP